MDQGLGRLGRGGFVWAGIAVDDALTTLQRVVDAVVGDDLAPGFLAIRALIRDRPPGAHITHWHFFRTLRAPDQ